MSKDAGQPDERLLQEHLNAIAGHPVILAFCCPEAGNCEYREFCRLGGGNPDNPMTYRQALIRTIERRMDEAANRLRQGVLFGSTG